jgi:hypothetical protein
MLFIVATVGEVDDVDFALAGCHGSICFAFCSSKVAGRGNSDRPIVKVAALACNVRLN